MGHGEFRMQAPSPRCSQGHRDCVGGIMALGDLGDNLAIVGAEFVKSCA